MLKTNLILISVIPLSTVTPGSFAAANPLFDSHQQLALVLELPLRELIPRARDKPTVAGVLRYTSSDGTVVVLDVSVSTRGNSRLEQCSFPPLSINLKRQQVASTLFAGQNKLKFVTQCASSASYRRYLSHEYSIYRIFNLVSKYSFRVRMLEVTYRDSSGRRADKVQPAFFIESDKEAAQRLNMTTVESNVVNISQLDTDKLSKFALFQFMIGNTDWSVRKGPGAEGCCHNGKVVAPADSDNGWVVLPYDFDQAGLINARYAMPSESLPIRSVRQRLYRGFCGGNAQLESTIATFNDNRAAIENLFDGSSGEPSMNKSALKYLQNFYAIVNDPEKRQKRIVAACRHTAN